MVETQLAFGELFTAEDISEPLDSVMKYENEKAKNYFEVKNYDVIGFQEKDQVIGYIKKKEFDYSKSWESMATFNVQDLITNNTNLLDCLKLLEKHTRLFVINKSRVESIVTMSDIQKPAVRMLFFGIVTFFESNLAELIHEAYPNDEWKKKLSECRVKKTMENYKKLDDINRETNLINCTQYCDKTDIFYKDNELSKGYINLSKTKSKEYFNEIEKLRNDLAHAQSLSIWFEEEDVIKLIDDLLSISEKIVSREIAVTAKLEKSVIDQ